MQTYPKVKVTLVDNSTRGTPSKSWAEQTVKLDREPDTHQMGVDGFLSVGHHPTHIFWLGGRAEELGRFTDVKIEHVDGRLLVNAGINANRGAPRNIATGVEFWAI